MTTSRGGFSQILRMTKKGRRPTFLSKLAVTVIFAAIFGAVWNLIELAFISGACELPLADAPIRSLESMENFGAEMTIMQYALCFFAVRILAAALLALFVFALSAMLSGSVAVMTATVMTALIPALLAYFGADIFAAVDFTGFLRATPMLIRDSGMYFMLASAAICTVGVGYAYRRWCD